MRARDPVPLITSVVLTLLAAVAVALLAAGDGGGVRVTPARGTIVVTPTDGTRAADWEAPRIRRWLWGAEEMLRARDVSGLRPEQRRARARMIRWLSEYRELGRFPRNYDFPDRRMPYFVDRHGTLCAVAYLIARSGRADLVARIAAKRNNAFVRELADDPGLIAWLESVGLTATEAARIQPRYDYQPPPDDGSLSPEYTAGTLVASGLSGAALTLNIGDAGDRPPVRWHGAFGLAAGALSLGLGLSKLDADGTAQLVGILNSALGAVTAGLGAHTLFSTINAGGARAAGVRRLTDESPAGHDLSLQVAPSARPGRASTLAVVLDLRF